MVIVHSYVKLPEGNFMFDNGTIPNLPDATISIVSCPPNVRLRG